MNRLMTVATGAVVAGAVSLIAFMGPAAPQSAPADAMAAARELVAAARATDQLKSLLPLITQQLKPVVVQGRPEVERDFDRIMPLLIAAFDQQLDKFAAAAAEIYASNFTADEMQQVTAFYRSPVGQKFLEKTPAIAQQSMLMGQKFGQQIVQELQTRIREELRKRGHNI